MLVQRLSDSANGFASLCGCGFHLPPANSTISAPESIRIWVTHISLHHNDLLHVLTTPPGHYPRFGGGRKMICRNLDEPTSRRPDLRWR